MQDHEAQLRRALAEGLLSPDEAEALRGECQRTGQSPLELLLARGRISEDTLAALRDEGPGRKGETVELPGPEAPVRRPTGPQPVVERTLSVGVPGAASPPAREAQAQGGPAFPVPGWERFQPVRFLGEGGMGRVFLAYDPRLRRQVALKFVRGDDPELSRRTLTEARAQARIDHARVCRVYEVGEVQGKVYIAMQFVDGRPLNALSRELTVEQKAMLLREAAEGVHEAHRAGLIHRDLKPSNILVERGEDGSLRPYVMDFGLARDWNEGVTATGTVLGTPQYMSPEQARGEVARLDRRTDVYSLGATLYHLLTGQAPIPGGNGLEVLSNLATVEPLPPRKVDPDLPVDLEAIVLKCLEKDRSARYDSARALAEDLDRFLSGEPVRARPAGWSYRLRKRLARHRRAVAGVSVAGVLVGLALGQAVVARREAAERERLARREVAERERLARRFTEQVELLEALSRYSGLSPPHDTRADRQALRERMAALEAEIQQAGEAAVGPGQYALGRGHLALEDMARAREHLEAAWNSGYQEPRVAYALAVVLGRLYQEQLLEAAHLPDGQRRESRKRQLEERLRDPALEYMKRSAGAPVPSAEYVSALIALHEGRHEDALKHLDAGGERLPWFHEGPKLRGDIFLARALARSLRGEREAALADLEEGRKAYARAASIGESVTVIHRAMADLEHEAMLMALYGKGDVEPAFQRGMEAVKRALAVGPDSHQVWIVQARLHRRLAESRMNRGEQVEALLGDAVQAARRAQELQPLLPQTRLEVGRCLLQWALYRLARREDPRAQLDEAARVFDSVAPEARDEQYHSDRGLIFKGWADYEDSVGADSLGNREKEIESYRRSIELDASQPRAWINLGMASFTRASHPRNPDVDGDLARARDALDRAIALDSRHVASYFYAAETQELLARRQRQRGEDARPTLEAALRLYREGLAINPRLPYFHNGVGSILLEQAREAWARGGRPDSHLADAQAAFEQAISVAPEQGYAYNNVGETHLWRAVYQRARGEDPGPSVRAADEALRKATARMPNHATFWVNLGWAHGVLAAFELDQGREPSGSLRRSSEALGRALALNPNHERAWQHQGELRSVKARWLARSGRATPADFLDAERAFQKAVELAPTRPESQLALGHFCRGWGHWLGGVEAEPVLRRGLALADALLTTRPGWPDALLLRASVLEELARSVATPAQQRELRERATEELRRAVEANPNLEHEWKNQRR